MLFETECYAISINVALDEVTLWLNHNRIDQPYSRDVKKIGKLINNKIYNWGDEYFNE